MYEQERSNHARPSHPQPSREHRHPGIEGYEGTGRSGTQGHSRTQKAPGSTNPSSPARSVDVRTPRRLRGSNSLRSPRTAATPGRGMSRGSGRRRQRDGRRRRRRRAGPDVGERQARPVWLGRAGGQGASPRPDRRPPTPSGAGSGPAPDAWSWLLVCAAQGRLGDRVGASELAMVEISQQGQHRHANDHHDQQQPDHEARLRGRDHPASRCGSSSRGATQTSTRSPNGVSSTS